MRLHLLALPLLACSLAVAAVPPSPLLNGGFRDPALKGGWIQIHLEGSPEAIGYQHGYLLRAEIEDNQRAIALSTTHEVNHSWGELRKIAEQYFVPKLTAEYRDELTGMARGLHAQGSKLDFTDLVAMNGYMEFSYYYDQEHRDQTGKQVSHAPEHCSAFVATGSYTKDGNVVIGHNNWSDYLTGTRWNVIFDVAPLKGHHFTMDGMPGLIHSGDDFGINDAGMMITETTISSFFGFDKTGTPEFVRARQAMQYSESIDDFAGYMKTGNNGGYANTWLIADRKTGEIGRLELGLKNVNLDRTKDGYFVGSNFPINPTLLADETTYPANSPNAPNNVRHRRWDQLMAENKGTIDIELAKKFETDHYDVITREIDPNERTLCGHIDRSSRGLPNWQSPFGPAGVAQVKVSDAAMAEKLQFVAGLGHPCGVKFEAAPFLKEHKEFGWQKKELHDVDDHGWATVGPIVQQVSGTRD
jgi:hypothetical protein